MTWIVGTLTPFGLGIVASDIRVTLADKSEVDCLQKIYPLGSGLLAGFAGSVKIGFSLLQALAFESAKLPPDKAWNLDVISNTWWPRVARRVFLSETQTERALGSQMLVAGTHPHKNQGPFPQAAMFTFSAPDFTPAKATAIASIGCGARAPDCMKVVESAFAKPDPEFLMLHEGGPQMVATAVGITLQETIRQSPTTGISPFFQVGVISRRLCHFSQSECFFEDDGRRKDFPEVAQDYDSLIRLVAKARRNIAATVC